MTMDQGEEGPLRMEDMDEASTGGGGISLIKWRQKGFPRAGQGGLEDARRLSLSYYHC